MVRELRLTSEKEWKEWSKSGQRSLNIPSCPQQVYHDAGWVSMADWLGYGVGRRPSRSSRGKDKRKRVERVVAPGPSDGDGEEEEDADEHGAEESEEERRHHRGGFFCPLAGGAGWGRASEREGRA